MLEVDKRVVLLPGDGIGPEVLNAARTVLRQIARRYGVSVDVEEHAIGGAAIDREGTPLSERALRACREADAVFLGAVGGPKWEGSPVRPEEGLLRLRKELGVYANLRPVKVLQEAARAVSPLRPERLDGVDFIVVRELTGGLYFGQPKWRRVVDGEEHAVDTLRYSASEVRRVASLAFRLARGRRGKVTSIDKANVLESSRLWRSVMTEVGRECPDVELEHQLVDSAAMRLITDPQSFDVIVTENMFGDILTDEAAVLGGSLGLLPSASLGDGRSFLYEPVHGAAPDIAGKGIANPIGAILSGAMLLRHSLNLDVAARQVEDGVERAVQAGAKTKDLGGTLTTEEMTQAILENITEERSNGSEVAFHLV